MKRIKRILLAILISSTVIQGLPLEARADESDYLISTVAGSDYCGDGGAAVAAIVGRPFGVEADGMGNLYIADSGNNRIRKVDADGNISTVAGTGIAGYSGDGGAAVSACLNGPAGIALDSNGNLFIADFRNNCIRKVDTDGIITTVAGTGTEGYSGDGGAAAAACLNRPTDVTVDGSGNLYITDLMNHCLRIVDAGGDISTAAGTGAAGYSGDGGAAASAQLAGPYGVAIDPSGNIFIADSSNHRIRKIDLSGIISTVAGTGVAGSSGDGGAATSAQLSYPCGIALDDSGNLFVSDLQGNCIRKVDAGGMISTVAGTGTMGFSGDGGAAVTAELYQPLGVDAAGGNLYIADRSNNRIRKVDSGGNISSIAGTGISTYFGDGGAAVTARLYAPYGVTIDGGGNLYIADAANYCVRKVDAASGKISTVAGTGTYGYTGDGGVATSAQIGNITGVVLDDSGNLYISDLSNYCIRKVDTDGNISTVAGTGVAGYTGDGGPAAAAQLNGPYGLAIDDSGNLYIADALSNCIRKVDTDSNISTVAGNGTAGYSGDGGAAAAAQLNNPIGISAAGGNIYIADSDNNRIRKIDTDGNISTIAGTGTAGYSGNGTAAVAAKLNGPSGVAVDSNGSIYIADTDNYCIRKVDYFGNITTLAGTGLPGYSGDGGDSAAAQLNSIKGISVYDGDIYIADTSNNRIRKIYPSEEQNPTSSGSSSRSSGLDEKSDFSVNVTEVNPSSLPMGVQDKVGDRPVYQFSLTAKSSEILSFSIGSAELSIPYVIGDGENPNVIVVYDIDSNGDLIPIRGGYDQDTGRVNFITSQFSQYVIGYNHVKFDDVPDNAWYLDAVDFIAARSITTGTSNGEFKPDAKLTRGEFLVMMMRAYGIEPATDLKNNFSDGGNTYYTGYLAAAKNLGITDGVGDNMFDPDKEITRQEMFTLLYHALKQINALPETTTGKGLNAYQDSDRIASWAKDSMTLFVNAETISGSNGMLAPSDSTTRAQMAQVLYNLMAK